MYPTVIHPLRFRRSSKESRGREKRKLTLYGATTLDLFYSFQNKYIIYIISKTTHTPRALVRARTHHKHTSYMKYACETATTRMAFDYCIEWCAIINASRISWVSVRGSASPKVHASWGAGSTRWHSTGNWRNRKRQTHKTVVYHCTLLRIIPSLGNRATVTSHVYIRTLACTAWGRSNYYRTMLDMWLWWDGEEGSWCVANASCRVPVHGRRDSATLARPRSSSAGRRRPRAQTTRDRVLCVAAISSRCLIHVPRAYNHARSGKT